VSIPYLLKFFLSNSDKILSYCHHDLKNIIILFLRKGYNLAVPYFGMEEERTMQICFTSDQLKLIEEYAKRKGMLNVSQAIEDLMTK
jgi:hypothetical protein